MNYCHSYIISIFACLLPISAIAQVEPDIIRPSVNAEQFSVAVKADAALSNGQLSQIGRASCRERVWQLV